MQAFHNLSDALYNVKEKLSSQEYLEIMNMLKALTLPLDNTVEGLMSRYKLDQNIAKFIFDCFEDPTFSGGRRGQTPVKTGVPKKVLKRFQPHPRFENSHKTR